MLAMLTIAIVGLGTFLLWPSCVTLENYYRIKEGMSRPELYSLLGPPGNYTTGPRRRLSFDATIWTVPNDNMGGHEIWEGDKATITVEFDRSGRVSGRTFSPMKKVEQNLVDDLVWRLNRRWRWFPDE
jgi:hypothetical protein